MTIELITGVPGAGKTTFAVATRIVPESTREFVVPIEDVDGIQWFVDAHSHRCRKLPDGSVAITRRVVCAGVRGLVVDHEVLPHKLTGDNVSAEVVDRHNAMAVEIGEDGRPREQDYPGFQRLAGTPPRTDVVCMVQSWWTWALPGDFIVVDEVQFLAPRGVMGRKPPYWIQALEIHRHYGVDFLFITQAPALVDTTIRNLVGMHRHVRSVLGSALCTVYAWDHASNTERITSASKSAFLRKRSHYRLFRSAAAHLKPPSAGRRPLLVIPVLVVAVVAGVVHFRGRFLGNAQAQAQGQTGQGAAQTAAAGLTPQTQRQTRPAGWVDAPIVRGCWAHAGNCQCIGDRGQRVNIALAMCEASSRGFDGLVAWEPSTAKRYEPQVQQQAQQPAAPSSSPAMLAAFRP